MDELSGEALTKRLGEIEESRAVLERRVKESEVGLAMLKKSVVDARDDLMMQFRVAVREARANRIGAIKKNMPLAGTVEERFTLEIFCEWLCYRAALDLLDSEHTSEKYALACAGQTVREANDEAERERAKEKEAERQDRLAREGRSPSGGYRPLHAPSEELPALSILP
jgi:hypothetical protein